MIESQLRTTACWLTVVAGLWTLCYYFAYGTKEGSSWIIEDIAVPLISEFDVSWENGARLVMLIAPLVIVTHICILIVTAAPHETRFQRFRNRIFASLRSFPEVTEDGIKKKNQFGLGELNFDCMGCVLVTIPVFFYCVLTLDKVLAEEQDYTTEEKLTAVGNAFGLAATLALSFFLIPVARHSILLVALGWSPLQALRIHIWAGYTSFVGIALHGLMHFIVWMKNEQETLWDQVIPGAACWEWKPSVDVVKPRECRSQWNNFTGVISFLFLAVLILTSINWFRRKYYRLFYIFHTTCAVGMLSAACMHWRPLITFLAPSIIYYLASTMPALVQAVASRARGGVRVVKVVHLANAGGCKEIHFAASPEANEALEKAPSMFVKLCVPSISLVCHPFTVFKHPQDPSTVRILFRPVGPFTKRLALRFEQGEHTPTIVDGFYHAGNRCLEALHHDHVTFYSGGVAITPFLSLIPCLLHKIADRKEKGKAVVTKKVSLHWACREEGLATYVTENYLHGMKLAADAMGLDFECFVYHTQKQRKKMSSLDPPDTEKHSRDSSRLDTTFLSELTLDGLEVSPAHVTSQDHEVATSNPAMGANEHEAATHIANYSKAEVPAHPFELHRFMPARHDRVRCNIPAFIAVGGSMWIFFYIIFYYYNGYDFQVHEFYDRLWPIIVCVLSSIGLGMAFESCCLLTLLSKLALRVVGAEDETSSGSRKMDPSRSCPAYYPVDEEQRNNVHVFVHRDRRPNVEDVLEEAQQAECPGIFMCGPPAMTELVRREAGKENSIFGLTRYAIYEDPFVM